jgi:hypothetical protein
VVDGDVLGSWEDQSINKDKGLANKGLANKGPANKGPANKGPANKGPTNKGPANKGLKPLVHTVRKRRVRNPPYSCVACEISLSIYSKLTWKQERS